jgi:hypothetical protein
MARRRVFQTKVECSGISVEPGRTSTHNALIGKSITFEKSPSTSEVAVLLGGAAVGHLDSVVGPQVASAIDRGQLFAAVVKNAYQTHSHKFNRTTVLIHLNVEYLLEKHQPAIEIPKVPLEIRRNTPTTFFTKVAGVTHEGRQQIVARCSVGERLILQRDPTNAFDKGAIKVMRLNGEQLGFLPEHVSRGDHSSGLAFQMDRGAKFQCRIIGLTGDKGKSLGVNIELTDGEEFDSVLVSEKAPAMSSASPAKKHFGCMSTASAMLLVVVAFIKQVWF